MPTITLTLDVGDPLTLRVLDVLGLRVLPSEASLRERLLAVINAGPATVAEIRTRLDTDGNGTVPRQSVANMLMRLKRDGLVRLDGREWRRVAR